MIPMPTRRPATAHPTAMPTAAPAPSPQLPSSVVVAAGEEGGGDEIKASTVGATIASTVTGFAGVLRKVEAAVLSASLAVMAVSAVSAAASLCMLTVKAMVTLPAVAVASTASRGTDASSATFWRIGVSTSGVKAATSPAMVTDIFTMYTYDAGGGALFSGDGGGGEGGGGEGGGDGGGGEGDGGDGGDGGGDGGDGGGDGDSGPPPPHAQHIALAVKSLSS